MTVHVCPYGHPPCGVLADIRCRFSDGHVAWFCREHSIVMVHRHGAQAVGRR